MNQYRVPILLLLLSIAIPTHASSDIKHEKVDSLILRVHSLDDNEEKLEMLIEIGNKLNWIDKEKAIPYVDASIGLAKKLNNDEQLGHALLERYENLITSKSSDSLQYIRDDARQAFRRANYREGEALIMVDMAMDAETSGDLNHAMKLYFQSQDIFEEVGNEAEFNANWVAIASLLNCMNRNEEALNYLKRAEEYVFGEGDDYSKGYFFMIKSQVYEDLNNLEVAKIATEEMLRIAIKNEFNNDIVTASTVLGGYALKSNDFEVAKEYYQKALDVSKELKGKYFTAYAQCGMADYHLRMNNFTEAKDLLLEARLILGEPIYAFYQNKINRDLGRAYAGLNESDSAYHYMSLYAVKQDSVHTEDSKRIASEIEAVYQNEKKERELLQSKTERQFLYVILGLFLLGLGSLFYAFRQKIKTNKILIDLNEQKEFLIKEIHHRVKNNLQIISSLLNLQSNVIEDDKAVSAVIEGRNRVQSMSLIHQKLYMGENLAEVDMQEYLDELSMHLLDSYGRSQKEIVISNNVEVPPLDVDTAIPLGLIINELLTNSLKYAFPDNRNGQIHSHLFINEKGELVVTISDNGIGTGSKENATPKSTKFGSNMVGIFSKKLKGKVEEFKSEEGFKTMISFERYQLGRG